MVYTLWTTCTLYSRNLLLFNFRNCIQVIWLFFKSFSVLADLVLEENLRQWIIWIILPHVVPLFVAMVAILAMVFLTDIVFNIFLYSLWSLSLMAISSITSTFVTFPRSNNFQKVRWELGPHVIFLLTCLSKKNELLRSFFWHCDCCYLGSLWGQSFNIDQNFMN